MYFWNIRRRKAGYRLWNEVRGRRLCFDLLSTIRRGRSNRAALLPEPNARVAAVNPDLNEDICNLIEAAELDPEQEAKLKCESS
jgi:hypothetical protein